MNMDNRNESRAEVFEFSGLITDPDLAIFLFILFLLVYIITVVGNVGLIFLVHKTPSLHTPMYYFLSYLSLVDLLYSSAVAPRMMSDLISVKKVISFSACALQFYVFATLAGTDVLLLSNMSYDRYVAICHPLHYVTIMTRKKCLFLVLLAFSLGFFQSSLQKNCIFRLQFCSSNLIDHFYCDVLPLLKLSCSDTLICKVLTVFFIGSYSIVSLTTILISYIFIMSSILKIRFSKGRKKAFSTCSSHLICASVFYLSVLFTYLRPSDFLKKQDKVSSVFYSVITPMLNPLFYSFRNHEVKAAILRAVLSLRRVVQSRLVGGLPASPTLQKNPTNHYR